MFARSAVPRRPDARPLNEAFLRFGSARHLVLILISLLSFRLVSRANGSIGRRQVAIPVRFCVQQTVHRKPYNYRCLRRKLALRIAAHGMRDVPTLYDVTRPSLCTR
jgi:hypothetical protein